MWKRVLLPVGWFLRQNRIAKSSNIPLLLRSPDRFNIRSFSRLYCTGITSTKPDGAQKLSPVDNVSAIEEELDKMVEKKLPAGDLLPFMDEFVQSGKSSNIEHSKETAGKKRSKSVKLDPRIFHKWLDYCSTEADSETADKAFRLMKKLANKGVDELAYKLRLESHWRSNNLKRAKAMKILEEMVMNVEVDEATFVKLHSITEARLTLKDQGIDMKLSRALTAAVDLARFIDDVSYEIYADLSNKKKLKQEKRTQKTTSAHQQTQNKK